MKNSFERKNASLCKEAYKVNMKSNIINNIGMRRIILIIFTLKNEGSMNHIQSILLDDKVIR